MSRSSLVAVGLLALIALPAASAGLPSVPLSLLPPLLPPPGPEAGLADAARDDGSATATCLLGRAILYCADTASDVSLDCTVNATHYECDVATSHWSSGSTRGPFAGEMLAPSDVEVGLCNGAGLCDQVRTPVGTPCSWDWDGHGCETSGQFATTLSGTLEGCLLVWVYQDVRAYVRNPESDLDLVEDQAGALAEFDSCA